MTKIVDFPTVCGVILAAGKGTRMKSDLPKVLHKIGEKTLLDYVVDAVADAGIKNICLVVGGDLDLFSDFLKQHPSFAVCRQIARQGTADAVAATSVVFQPVVRPHYANGELIRAGSNSSDCQHVLIGLGDTPAISAKTLAAFVNFALSEKVKLAVLGMRHPNPFGYGRLIMAQNGSLVKVVEEKNATSAEKLVDLCNTGVIFAEKEYLFSCLADVPRNDLTQEYYLTECFGVARSRGDRVGVYETANFTEFEGVNDQDQLRNLEKFLKEKGS